MLHAFGASLSERHPTPVNLSTYLILDRPPNARRPSVKNISTAVSLLTFTAVIFRAEVALLLAPIVLQSLYLRYIGFFSIVKVGFFSALAAIGMSRLSHLNDHALTSRLRPCSTQRVRRLLLLGQISPMA